MYVIYIIYKYFLLIISLHELFSSCQYIQWPRGNCLPDSKVYLCIFQELASITLYFPFSLPNAV